MFSVHRWLPVAVCGVLSLSLMPQAHASLILAGDSNSSTFTGCGSGCSTSVTLGSTANGGSNSVLSIVDTSFATSVNATGLVLAELQLAAGNKAGAGEDPLNFNYNLVLNFTTPTGVGNDTFSIGLSGTGSSGSNGAVNITGLVPTLTDPFVLPGVTLSNFHFVDVLDSGSGTTFSAGNWTVNGQATATLELVADVTDPPTGIPEPTTLALFGSALVCAGIFGRQKSRRKV